jgi:hypothetical protein
VAKGEDPGLGKGVHILAPRNSPNSNIENELRLGSFYPRNQGNIYIAY